MQRAVFLDRDGTINEEVGYLNHIDRLRLYPWAAPAIRRLNQAGFRTLLITNQGGVARGLFPEYLIHEVHSRMQSELERFGAHLDGIYYCPHHPEGRVEQYRIQCNCRKPRPGMIERAAREWDLDFASSFLVGDKYVDLETGFRFGLRNALVLSGYGRGEYLYRRHSWTRSPDIVVTDLAAAVDWILETASNGDLQQHVPDR